MSLIAAQLTAGGSEMWAQQRSAQAGAGDPVSQAGPQHHYTLHTIHTLHHCTGAGLPQCTCTIIVIEWFPLATLYIGKLKTVLLLLFIGKSGKIEKTSASGAGDAIV